MANSAPRRDREDEQLSLAIAKRPERAPGFRLIGCRIEHQERERRQGRGCRRAGPHCFRAPSTAAASAGVGGVASAPGVSAELALLLDEAGLGDAETIVRYDRDSLLEVEGIDEELADSLYAWAEAQVRASEERADADIGATFRAPAPKSGGMGDDDFMAALSRAFQESEQQRGAAPPGEALPKRMRPASPPARAARAKNRAKSKPESFAGDSRAGHKGALEDIWERFESRTSPR